jgi:hypothetical protein
MPAFQPNFAHPAKVPEYFAEFRDKGDLLSTFLGCGIVAKVGIKPEIFPLANLF